ncbi:MAG: ribonuclease P protein component [Muribaculaceae bacterium]|nr:ribonuclease P protein component [Muribaculaceae bacterium]
MYRLHKYEKLCSRTAIELIFSEGSSAIAYPLRAAFRVYDTPEGERSTVRFYVSIPKKKIRTAVGRVLLRRRVREAYRLNHAHLSQAACDAAKNVDVAFLYLADSLTPYSTLEDRLKALLSKIEAKLSHP